VAGRCVFKTSASSVAVSSKGTTRAEVNGGLAFASVPSARSTMRLTALAVCDKKLTGARNRVRAVVMPRSP